MTGYISTAQAPESLGWNVFDEMGNMYDTIYYLVDWQNQDKSDITTQNEWGQYYYRLGAYFGILANQILEAQKQSSSNASGGTVWTPLPVDPGSDMSWV